MTAPATESLRTARSLAPGKMSDAELTKKGAPDTVGSPCIQWGLNGETKTIRRWKTVLYALALSGCAAHEVYEHPNLDMSVARADWAECQRAALAASGVTASGSDLGNASLRSGRLVGEMAADPEKHEVAGYSAEDWARISQRRKFRQDCMSSRGYRFVGVPATERL